MELPETVPEKVIITEPTVPKLMVLPRRVPSMLSVTGGSENTIVPVRCDPDCSQSRVIVCVAAPLDCPDHLPERSAGVARAVVAAARGAGVTVGAAVLDLTAVFGDDDECVVEEQHAAPRIKRTTAIPRPSTGLHLTTCAPPRDPELP
jgi:hypothetical protein